jgi:4-hydroxy-tetrahydrodipicolinate synthase
MKYRKSEAKEYAKKNIKGLWGASLTPFKPDYKIDEEGFRHNIRYLIDHLQMDGMFINGLMGEGFHQTIAERKRIFAISVEESKGKMAIMPYTSDSVLENALDMTKYAEDIGADYAIMINPKFYFGALSDEGVFQYFNYIADRVNIAILIFNQMEHGYLISPQLISRIADIPNIVGIKNIAPQDHVQQTRILCGEKIVVSDGVEENWLINMTTKGQEAMIASPDPFCLQSKKLKLVREYTDLAMKGEIKKAWEAYKKVEPIRRALKRVTVPGKVQATYKYWTQILGMAGGDGRARLPQMELTEGEKQAIRNAIAATGLI